MSLQPQVDTKFIVSGGKSGIKGRLTRMAHGRDCPRSRGLYQSIDLHRGSLRGKDDGSC